MHNNGKLIAVFLEGRELSPRVKGSCDSEPSGTHDRAGGAHMEPAWEAGGRRPPWTLLRTLALAKDGSQMKVKVAGGTGKNGT